MHFPAEFLEPLHDRQAAGPEMNVNSGDEEDFLGISGTISPKDCIALERNYD